MGKSLRFCTHAPTCQIINPQRIQHNNIITQTRGTHIHTLHIYTNHTSNSCLMFMLWFVWRRFNQFILMSGCLKEIIITGQCATRHHQRAPFLPPILACVLLRHELPQMAGRRTFPWEGYDPLLYAQGAVHAPTCMGNISDPTNSKQHCHMNC